MGTQAQAVGAGREYAGLLGRADRLVVLAIVPVIQYFDEGYGNLNYMTLMCYCVCNCVHFICHIQISKNLERT